MHSYHDIFDLVSLNNISNTPKSGFFIILMLNMILELFLSEPHPKSGPKTMHAAVAHRRVHGFGTGFGVGVAQKQLQNHILHQNYEKS